MGHLVELELEELGNFELMHLEEVDEEELVEHFELERLDRFVEDEAVKPTSGQVLELKLEVL